MTYRERLRAPVSYWIIALAFGVSFATAVGFYLGPWVAVAAGLLTTGGIAAFLLTVGHVDVEVSDAGVRVRDAVLEWSYLGSVRVLDAVETRRRLGPDANAAAFVVQRPWIGEAVEIEVNDPADPHPYWLVSSRTPAGLAASVERARPQAAS